MCTNTPRPMTCKRPKPIMTAVSFVYSKTACCKLFRILSMWLEILNIFLRT